MKRIIAALLLIVLLQSMFIAHSIPIVLPHDRWSVLTWAHDTWEKEHQRDTELAMLELGSLKIPAMPPLKGLPR